MNPSETAVLVTGGASGLGRATAERLLAAGARVVIADRDISRGQELAAAHASTHFEACDVTEPLEVEAAFARAVSAVGPLGTVVQCAGIARAEKILSREGEPQTLESFEEVIRINLLGTFNVLRVAAATLARNEPGDGGSRGVIVTTASIAAFDGQIGQTAYAASKAGVAALTLPAARELAREGIRVVCIAPGIFDTPLLAGLPEKARETLAARMPFPRRLGDPGEFASLVEEVIRNDFINGETIRLDGALRMPPR